MKWTKRFFGERMSTGSLSVANVMYRVFKYSVYGLLTLNIFLFFQEESLAIQQTFSQGIGPVSYTHLPLPTNREV